ncbi:hypothetical protein GTA08_BOTSDO01798 [Botryosphaeria dothidea]|uniref:Fe2OG dioxygenase domain-containing protein n=1 Tax=Botryosphaeria dothidea TaxID=55169 RepID=A0A8H4J081_9PEZI|nr:hypothetical protein GTA08_BOTSDO01798 [Botryosphaeria dothidea]
MQPRSVDFNVYATGSDAEKVACACELVRSLHETGFCKITKHAIPDEVLDRVFEWTDRFFNLPEGVKAQIRHPPEHNPHRGWSELGRETVSTITDYEKGVRSGQKLLFDIKASMEAFDMGNPQDPLFANMWLPEEDLPGFRADMESFYDHCRSEHLRLLEALRVGCRVVMGPGFDIDFAGRCKQSASECRINYYPGAKVRLLRGECNRISPHTDFGTLTLLFQDDIGGLEIEDQARLGTFVPVSCASHREMLVNSGDILMRWSNDYFRSVNHRVTIPPHMQGVCGDAEVPSRRSVAFFAKPDRDTDAGTLPAFTATAGDKYEHISALEFNQIKLKLTIDGPRYKQHHEAIFPHFPCAMFLIVIASAGSVGARATSGAAPAGVGLDFEWSFSGISTFGHLPHARCRLEPDARFDIAVVGVPFDSATSYRCGARLGPRAARNAPARHVPSRGFNTATGNNPYQPCATLGSDVAASPTHLDTLRAAAYPAGADPDEEELNHGTVLRHAAAESLIAMPSVHVDLNTRLTGVDTADLAADAALGFVSVAAAVIEEGAGVRGLARRIANAVVGHGRSGKLPVFLSVDIDVLDRRP